LSDTFFPPFVLGGPMVPRAMNADSESANCWDHRPNETGGPLINTSDCCVAIVCQSHPECCSTNWTPSCVQFYENDVDTCNANATCNYLGPSDIMTPTARSDTAGYTR
jgi:hypothetical protein